MPVLGITGRMGSGKSTVSKWLHTMGVTILDADQISREVVRKGTRGHRELVLQLGEMILNQKGEIDREKLANLIFKDHILMKNIQHIIHVEIAQYIEAYLKQVKPQDIIALDVVLPVRKGFLEHCDQVWGIYAEENDSIQRVMERNGWEKEKIMQRLQMQPSWEEYKKEVDVIIENTGTIKELHHAVQQAYQKFVRRTM